MQVSDKVFDFQEHTELSSACLLGGAIKQPVVVHLGCRVWINSYLEQSPGIRWDTMEAVGVSQ